MADQYGNRIPTNTYRGDQSSMTNEMIRDHSIHNSSNTLQHNHQQFMQHQQQLETLRIANHLHERQQLQQQPNATNSFYMNKFQNMRNQWQLHTHALNRSFSQLANNTGLMNTSAALHPTNTRLFTPSFIASIPPTGIVPTHIPHAPSVAAPASVLPSAAAAVAPTSHAAREEEKDKEK